MYFENKFLIFDSSATGGLKGFIKRLTYFGNRICFSLLNKLIHPQKLGNRKYNVAICAIFKNEAHYLKEWIEFHKIIGIDHFYLYNNFSTDNYLKVLQPYIDEETVTLLDWTKKHSQMECYADGWERFNNECRWIGYIDIDEFIVPNATDNVYDFLKRFEDKPCVIVYWKMYCSSGLIDRPTDSLITETFKISWRKYSNIGKCFCNCAYGLDHTYKYNKAMHHHNHQHYCGIYFPPVNVFGKICITQSSNPIPIGADPTNFPIQINHYFTKSLKEYRAKMARGDVYFENDPHDFEYFYRHDKNSQSVDYHAYKYLIKLKLALKERENDQNGVKS